MQLREGTIKGEVQPGLRSSACCYHCHLGVLAQALGCLLSHRPPTLAASVPLE